MTASSDRCKLCGLTGAHYCAGPRELDDWKEKLQKLVEEARPPSSSVKERIERLTKLKQLMREFPNRSVEDLIRLLEVSE